MPSNLAERLSAARRRYFIGRDAERSLFASALNSAELPFHVLHVYGPGGVGKTTLLKEMAATAELSRARAIYLDARNVDATPNGVIEALRAAMRLAASDSPVEALKAQPGRQVILIDTYETLEQLDGWLRDAFLPQLPENALIVLAGRNPPSPVWRTDAGWQMLIHYMPLRNLNLDESRAYLSARNVPADQHASTLDFTHGHPLALSLVADMFAQHGSRRFEPQAAPDMI